MVEIQKIHSNRQIDKQTYIKIYLEKRRQVEGKKTSINTNRQTDSKIYIQINRQGIDRYRHSQIEERTHSYF